MKQVEKGPAVVDVWYHALRHGDDGSPCQGPFTEENDQQKEGKELHRGRRVSVGDEFLRRLREIILERRAKLYLPKGTLAPLIMICRALGVKV